MAGEEHRTFKEILEEKCYNAYFYGMIQKKGRQASSRRKRTKCRRVILEQVRGDSLGAEAWP